MKTIIPCAKYTIAVDVASKIEASLISVLVLAGQDFVEKNRRVGVVCLY